MSTVNPIPKAETSRPIPRASDADIEAARAYERIFVPALFRHWPAHLIAAAGVKPRERTLDVACGTGVLTRALAAAVGEQPAPVGLDVSPGMLEVARSLHPHIEWRHGDAGAMPFADASFHRVLCQFGLMFFADRVRAVAEMSRLLAPGGRLAFAVWDALERSPGFSEKVDVLDRVAGRRAGDALRAPFCLGERAGLGRLAEAAELRRVRIETVAAEARFPSLRAFVDAEVRGWLPVMGVCLSEDEIATVHAECERCLAPYEDEPGGSLTLPVTAHVVSADPAGRPAGG